MALVKKIFDYFIWVIFFGLFLLGIIIYISNRTYPGDDLYPLKLKFENFVLATSKILNKQVDFSIDLVSKRSNEVAKILTPKNSSKTLSRLDTQVEETATSISQISNPVEKKRAAIKYIAKLNEVTSILAEKQKELETIPTQQTQRQPTFVQQQVQNIIPTSTPSPEIISVSEQINNTQQTIDQTINQMNNLATTNNEVVPTPSEIQKKQNKDKEEKEDKKDKEDKKEDDKKQ